MTPNPTHSDHDRLPRRSGLGKLSNDEYWISRHSGSTPFRSVSVVEAAGDLPDIADAGVDICIPFPDHRVSTKVHKRSQVHCIPTQPYGMNFAKTWNEGRGVMTAAERESYPPAGRLRTAPGSRGWTRVHPHNLFSTVTTVCQYTDARVGKVLHWKQQRPLTVMEVRRAQGIPDHEVLLGRPPDQWKMVGNAVARQMSLVLGLAFREAWLGNLYEDGGETDEVEAADLEDVALGESASSPIPAPGDERQAPGLMEESDSDTDVASCQSVLGSADLVRTGAGSTPPTSEAESAVVPGLVYRPQKRPLSQCLVIEIPTKKPRV